MGDIVHTIINGQHDERGKFAKGNKLGAGNGNHRRMNELRASVMATTTPEMVRAVMAKMQEMATAGDCAAAKIWLDHVIGRPLQAVAISGPDGEPLTDLARIKVEILAALTQYPDARAKVAKAMLALSGEATGDGPVE